MRNAISCFAPARSWVFQFGERLPARRRSTRGYSLKSISRSEVCLPFFARRLARADD